MSVEFGARRHTKKWQQFLEFEVWIKTKKRVILFHPDYVLMTWETYKSMIKKEKPLVIEDEFTYYKDSEPIRNS